MWHGQDSNECKQLVIKQVAIDRLNYSNAGSYMDMLNKSILKAVKVYKANHYTR